MDYDELFEMIEMWSVMDMFYSEKVKSSIIQKSKTIMIS